MEKKRNKLNHHVFANAKEALEKALPYGGIKKAIYVRDDFKESEVFPKGMRDVARGAVAEMRDGEVVLRVYRNSDEAHLLHDVDEQIGVDKATIQQPAKSEIENHHITHSMEEDMMERNQMTAEFISDGNGGLKPNIGPDGMIPVYVNFPDPTEEMIRKTVEQFNKNSKEAEQTQ